MGTGIVISYYKHTIYMDGDLQSVANILMSISDGNLKAIEPLKHIGDLGTSLQ